MSVTNIHTHYYILPFCYTNPCKEQTNLSDVATGTSIAMLPGWNKEGRKGRTTLSLCPSSFQCAPLFLSLNPL